MKYIGILVCILVVLAFAGYFFFNSQTPLTPNASSRPTPAGQVLSESSLGFSITIPQGFIVEEQGDYNRLLVRKTNEPSAGPTNFIYISVIPNGKEFEAGAIYNYSPADIQALRQSQIRDTVTLGNQEVSDLAQYYQYEHLEGTMLGGYGAKVFKNSKPWEFPAGTTEYRYLVEFAQVTYLIGGYVGTDTSSPYHLSKNTLDQTLATLKLTPESVKTQTSPPAEGDWKTYNNPTYGISFEYPGAWEQQPQSQQFPNGDIFALVDVGQTQRTETEFYDGVSFAVMKPFQTPQEITPWIKERYESQEPIDPSQPNEYSQVSFGGIQYEKVVVCGLGCFTYYHTKQNGKVYGFLVNAVGPNQAVYESAVSRIMSSMEYF